MGVLWVAGGESELLARPVECIQTGVMKESLA